MDLVDPLIFTLMLGLATWAIFLRYQVISPLLLVVVLLFVPTLWSIWSAINLQPLVNVLAIAAFLICAWLYSKLVVKPVSQFQAAIAEVSTVPETPVVPILTKEEEVQLRTCFPLSVYYLQKIEYRHTSVICTGQLRQVSTDQHGNRTANSSKSATEVAYETVKARIQANFGDRFLVLLQEKGRDLEKPQADYQYFFLLIPNTSSISPSSSKAESRAQIWLATGLVITTLISIEWVGIKLFHASGEELNVATVQNSWLYFSCGYCNFRNKRSNAALCCQIATN